MVASGRQKQKKIWKDGLLRTNRGFEYSIYHTLCVNVVVFHSYIDSMFLRIVHATCECIREWQETRPHCISLARIELLSLGEFLFMATSGAITAWKQQLLALRVPANNITEYWHIHSHTHSHIYMRKYLICMYNVSISNLMVMRVRRKWKKEQQDSMESCLI